MATKRAHNFRDLTGQEFGSLTAMEYIGGRKWKCECKCGRFTEVFRFNLLRRDSTSCGACGRHGMKNTPTYVSWEAMVQRCTNPNHVSYPQYGGVGVAICKRWRDSFAAFLEDVGERPGLEYSLDRFPNAAGNYEPGNCRWATQSQQHRNKKSNRLLTFRGETRCAIEWAEILNLPRTTLYNRLRRGWAVGRALTTPARA